MNPVNFFEESEWKDFVEKLKKEVSPIPADEEFFIISLIDVLQQSLSKINGKFTLLFSAGADSTLLAVLSKKLNKNFELLSVGFENSEDIVLARKFAKDFKFEYREKILCCDEVFDAIKRIFPLFKNDEFVVKELACFEYLALKESLPLVVTGTGCEEIFAGYNRHLRAEKPNEECWKGLENIFWKRDLYRIKILSRIITKKIFFPFLDKKVMTLAMSMPSDFKIKNNFRKYIIARTLSHLGIPDDFAFRKKKAAQYGSGLDKFFAKLVKKRGLNKKKELFTQEFLNKL